MSSMPDEGSAPPHTNGSEEPEGPKVVVGDAMALGNSEGLVVGETDSGDAIPASTKVLEYLQEARDEGTGDDATIKASAFRKFKRTEETTETADVLSSSSASADRPSSSAGSFSNPDDTPSLHGSIASSSLVGSPFGSRFSPSPSLRPFDRRFSSRLQPGSPALLPRDQSPSLLGAHSRNSSVGSRVENFGSLEDKSAPWEVIRWTKLKKITSQVMSEAGRRSFGSPTCIVVSATIAIGTDKGLVLVFDYSQVLKAIIGSGTKAVECGAVTALGVSADHTTIAAGHANGHIFTWEIAKASRPFLHIPPLPSYEMENRKGDSHVDGVTVLHVGFLGQRRTALVSADDRGMAFSHLATRGLGAVGRAVKTTRILGRYPMDTIMSGRPRKPSSVLGMSVLPLGNSPERTDSMGLVAMLTPYLLVIVSTTPIAQTQYKAVKPKEVASECALSGCLAWYPSVKLKQSAAEIVAGKPASTKAKLAYVWSNVLTLLELSIMETDDPEDAQRPPTLEFRPRSRFRCDEAIVAVQWISRQIISVLTVTQRLIILEDNALRVTETFDLMSKYILHPDMFSRQLHDLVDRMDEEGSLHPHVADAFYNSFKVYKGRIFLLCSYEVSVGALSNWADRLLAMMEVGDFIGAIQLATAYYIGDINKLTIGLPDDPKLRHPIVEEKLIEMMGASLRYAFGKNYNSSRTDVLDRTQLEKLATACFDACIAMGRTDFLFDDAFDYFEQGGSVGVFLETLEPHILERRVSFTPPTVVKALVTHYIDLELESRLEDMICQMDTRTLDIDQVTTLCKAHQLFDALIYVWNRALADYITPMIDLLTLLIPLIKNGVLENGDSMNAVNALKLFPYLAYTLTGRVYPTGEELPEPEAANAKAQIYYFLFLGRPITWPKGGKLFQTKRGVGPEPSFPYLRLILSFDASSFLSALNEAFEDPFLNGSVESVVVNGSKQDAGEEQVFGRSVNRQYIISILLEVMSPSDFAAQDTIYLDMFIARNIPKFSQFILLSGSSLHRVLVGLCNPPGQDIADDCQLSVEYLLTVYRPPDLDGLVEHFTRARFFRVLKSIFRTEKQYSKLMQTYFDDSEALEAVFDCISECLRPRSGLTVKQTAEVKSVILKNSQKYIEIDVTRAARVIDAYAGELHGPILKSIEVRPQDQFAYLRTILEMSAENDRQNMKRPAVMENAAFVESYIRLMCQYDPEHVSDYVGRLQSGDLQLENVLPAMESSGVMDAAVVLMAREGRIRQAMDRLLAHLGTLEMALMAVVKSSANVVDLSNSNEAAKETLQSLQKYARVGVWLCQGQMKSLKAVNGNAPRKRRSDNNSLSSDEVLWLDLLDTIVGIAKRGISAVSKTNIKSDATEEAELALKIDAPMLTNHLRQFVQDTFSSLLTATSKSQSVSFLNILRAFLARAVLSSPSIADLRSVLHDIFEAYLYESQLLTLANNLLDKDLFIHVSDAAKLRQRGWRPAAQACEACGKRIWGPGAAGGIYAAWEKKRVQNQRLLEDRREERRIEADDSISVKSRGKGKARDTEEGNMKDVGTSGTTEEHAGELVLFSCRHVYHRKCLDNLQAATQDGRPKCTVCGSR